MIQRTSGETCFTQDVGVGDLETTLAEGMTNDILQLWPIVDRRMQEQGAALDGHLQSSFGALKRELHDWLRQALQDRAGRHVGEGLGFERVERPIDSSHSSRLGFRIDLVSSSPHLGPLGGLEGRIDSLERQLDPGKSRHGDGPPALRAAIVICLHVRNREFW